MKLYALSLVAGRYEVGSFRVVSIPFVIFASNDDEAMGRGIRSAMERWPQAEGWSEYQASPVEVPATMIEMAYQDISNKT